MLGILTSVDLLQGICLSCHRYWWVGVIPYSLLWHCLDRSGIHDFDRDYKGDDLASGLDGWFENRADFLKVNCDNMSANYIAKNQVYHERMKHIDIRYHFMWDILEDGDIELKSIHTKSNPVDMPTKVISGVKFNHCKDLLCILPFAWVRWSLCCWTMWGLIP